LLDRQPFGDQRLFDLNNLLGKALAEDPEK
jgi:hypothetical protein